MEQSLCKAAMKGSVESLHKIIGEDGQILDKSILGYFNGSPLHIAASHGHTQFVKDLLQHNPELAEVLDLGYRSALHFASAKGHLDIVKELVRANQEMCLACDRDGRNPLHIAAMKGKVEILKELLRVSPQAAEVLDSGGRSALHLASAEGHVEIVKTLTNPEMCLACDRDGRNPLHIAAMKGNNEVLKELVQANNYAARVKVEGETILHLCVKHNQLETLKLLLEEIVQELVNAKDGGGNTILHLAVSAKKLPIVRYVLENSRVKVDVNATNANGHTVMDILAQNGTNPDVLHLTIEDFLREAKAKKAKDLIHGEWLTKKRDALLVVASLIATMAFQAGVNPPAGVWQDNSNVSRVAANPPTSDLVNSHRAGEAIMAYNYQDSYPHFLRFNTIGFIMSLSTILLLISGLPFRKKFFMWVLVVIMWCTITSMAVTYAYAIVVVTPKKDRESLSNTIKVAVIAWSSVMAALLIAHTIRLTAKMVKEKRNRDKAIKKIFKLDGGTPRGQARARPNSLNGSQTNV